MNTEAEWSNNSEVAVEMVIFQMIHAVWKVQNVTPLCSHGRGLKYFQYVFTIKKLQDAREFRAMNISIYSGQNISII